MGGLRRRLPAVFWTFLIGSASLAALPLVTAGFYSKDLILWAAWSSSAASPWLWAAGALGAFLTAIYSFRLVFIVFFGDEKGPRGSRPGLRILIPLVVLAVLSVIGGFVETPGYLGHVTFFTDLTGAVLPEVDFAVTSHETEHLLQAVVGGITLVGVFLAYLFYLKKPAIPAAVKATSVGSVAEQILVVRLGLRHALRPGLCSTLCRPRPRIPAATHLTGSPRPSAG